MKGIVSLILFINFSSCFLGKEGSLPNIILISVDDMGWSDLGCYGSEINTPNIDKLAYNGIRFTSFYNTAKCFPSRAALITGVYAQDCGYDRTHTNPITNAVTIGEVLRTVGYATYWSGKHHGKENPYHRGFDHYFGLKDGAANHFNPGHQREGEAKPAQKRNNRAWAIDSAIYKPYTPPEKDFYSTDYFTNYALAYLDKSKKSSQPFFLYLAYTAPHDPLMAWREDIRKYQGIYDLGYQHIRQKRYEKQLRLGLIDSTFRLTAPGFRKWEDLSEDQRKYEAKIMEVYAAMIDRIDQNIGRLIAHLNKLEYNKNTLILFVSDNGASAEMVNLKDDDKTAPIGSRSRWISLGIDWANVSNTPFKFYKNFSYEGGINTPFIAYWPGRIKSNSFSRYPGHFIDFMATFIDITKASYPRIYKGQKITPLRGQSLLPIFEYPQQERTTSLFWQWKKGQAMRLENWKLVRKNQKEAWELYHIKDDPTETNNLAQDKVGLVHQMDSLFQEWISKYNE